MKHFAITLFLLTCARSDAQSKTDGSFGRDDNGGGGLGVLGDLSKNLGVGGEGGSLGEFSKNLGAGGDGSGGGRLDLPKILKPGGGSSGGFNLRKILNFGGLSTGNFNLSKLLNLEGTGALASLFSPNREEALEKLREKLSPLKNSEELVSTLKTALDSKKFVDAIVSAMSVMMTAVENVMDSSVPMENLGDIFGQVGTALRSSDNALLKLVGFDLNAVGFVLDPLIKLFTGMFGGVAGKKSS